MSFQENRFPIILGAVTAIATGGLVWWGMKSGGVYDEAKSGYDDAVGEIERLLRANPSPTDDNLREKKKAVADYRASVDGLQKAFDKYRQFELENTEVSAFNDALLAAKARATSKFAESDVTVPPTFFLGFSRYSDKLPQKKNTGLLHYALGAFEDLFGRLAAASPSELLNVYWEELPEERGQTYDFQGKGYRAHSIEVTFRGSEESLRQFLSSLDDSDKYYYIVRTMRILNERSTAPNAKDATFETPAAPEPADDPFSGFVFPTDDSAPADEGAGDGAGTGDGDDAAGEAPAEPEAPADPVAPSSTDSGQMLKQVLGGEEILVFMRIDVLQFVQPKELPKE